MHPGLICNVLVICGFCFFWQVIFCTSWWVSTRFGWRLGWVLQGFNFSWSPLKDLHFLVVLGSLVGFGLVYCNTNTVRRWLSILFTVVCPILFCKWVGVIPFTPHQYTLKLIKKKKQEINKTWKVGLRLFGTKAQWWQLGVLGLSNSGGYVKIHTLIHGYHAISLLEAWYASWSTSTYKAKDWLGYHFCRISLASPRSSLGSWLDCRGS